MVENNTTVIEDSEKRFHEEMLRIYDEAAELGYRPTYFLRMVRERGGLDAAKQLLKGNELSDGLVRLWELGRLDLSMEALVQADPWSTLFTFEELTQARQRLEQLGYGER